MPKSNIYSREQLERIEKLTIEETFVKEEEE